MFELIEFGKDSWSFHPFKNVFREVKTHEQKYLHLVYPFESRNMVKYIHIRWTMSFVNE